MLDLTKIKMPSALEVEGVFYAINTDFRKWLLFSRLIKDNSSTMADAEKLIYIDAIPTNKEKSIEAIYNFYNPPHELPRKVGATSGAIALDYDIDADLIYAAFLQGYKIDLLGTDCHGHAIELHWHKFIALLSGLKDTKLNEIMSYRGFIPNNKITYEKQMIELKQSWEIRPPESEESKRAREEFNALLEKPKSKK